MGFIRCFLEGMGSLGVSGWGGIGLGLGGGNAKMGSNITRHAQVRPSISPQRAEVETVRPSNADADFREGR